MDQSLFNLTEHTNRSIFLTGKAGTGKTTFLNEFVKKTKKKHIVVAPTGIAAINAGGVTIHSMFGLPLRTFIPTTDRIDSNLGNNISDLMQHFKYRKDKLKLLREIEIIIIDEVSMLRADVLDMMDFSLRFVRRNQQKFGGVQMLFIGDLYQLPPVVRDEHFLGQYYKSPFFFESYALKEMPLITLELTTVYRQTDEKFLDILNDIRDGAVGDIDFETLNERYIPDFEPTYEAYVYLTSHNRMADEINQKKIAALKGKPYFYSADIVGNFNENQYPNEEELQLKVGAQVMFIRNDASSEKRYFNGKLAEVMNLDDKEITVLIDGDDEVFKIKKETWEQKRYGLDADKNITEDVLGSFQQYPIRLAWAVTIHKSQGLTFDRLIIDAGKSFASGQVYVALSRCRTLEGIVLKSKITPNVIFADRRVSKFQDETNANAKIDEILEVEKYDYSIKKVVSRLDCLWFKFSLEKWFNSTKTSKALDKNKAQHLYQNLKPKIENFGQVYQKFEKIMLQKTHKFINGNEEWSEIETKAKGAVNFFFTKINLEVFQPLLDFYAENKGTKGLKEYNEDFRVFLDDLEDYLNDLKKVYLLEIPLFNTDNNISISTKVAKIPSHILSFQLFEEGKTIPEIAKERGLVSETIFGHLAKFAEQGLLDIARIFDKQKIKTFEKEFKKSSHETLNDWKRELPNDFEFNEIRLLLNHFNHKKSKTEK
ncbi:helix-turn-helix domain-containing protein [Kaistella antarctica]|uniref:ATPase AAA n=1 Tax=Kaistella antarctica TaxID=266748 RepID=A0A3S4W4J9_9FLAO|nr:helix-turn-helix domain-containing protein [Kaistella antarctica]KEY18747.1 ATPase AAA [Kaistella antarctica]SEW15910.1 Helicase [Kaistella antarctica]VEH99593.1 conjugal transfer relaxase TraA [Kaistella antarctica]